VKSQRFVAILVTDIVSSTERAAELRDTAWQELRRRHDTLVRRDLRQFGGREVNTAGDSFLATFEEPEQAIRCAASIRRKVSELGIELRSGVHIGKVEGEGRDLGGLALHVATRVASQAEPGKILVTEGVREALAGSSLDFEDAGTHVLKGLPGDWRLYTLTGEPMPVPATQSWKPQRQARLKSAAFLSGRPRVPRAFAALVLGFLIGLGVLFAWLRSDADTDAGGRKVIAVLPFENVGAAEDEYFADGMTDELRGKLSALPGLKVIASQSSAEYKKSEKSLAQIGHELGADYLVVGKVRWEKGAGGKSRVRVSPELVEVASGGAPSTKWQAPFDAALTNVFQVQADIAARVASELDVALGTDQRQALEARPTANLAAYDAYLKGREVRQSGGSPAARRSAIEFFERAVALDSTFSSAWVELARSEAAYYAGVTPTAAGAERARAASQRALALAPEAAESHHALGAYLGGVRGDHAAALAAFEAGLRIAPDDVELLVAASLAEQVVGRWEAAQRKLARALALDPRSRSTARRLANTLLLLRRYPEAREAFHRALALDPTNLDVINARVSLSLAEGDLEGGRELLREVPDSVDTGALVAHMATYGDLGWVLDREHQRLLLELEPVDFADDRAAWALALTQAYALQGDTVHARVFADSARLAFDEQLRGTPDDAQLLVLRALALGYLGRAAEAVREGERAVALTPIAKDAYLGPYLQHQLVRIYILAGEPEKALDRLEPLLQVPYYLSPGWLRIDPNFDPLRSNPRFQRLAAAS
jgi:TolB-like protein